MHEKIYRNGWWALYCGQCGARGITVSYDEMSTLKCMNCGYVSSTFKVVKDIEQFPEDLRIREFPTQKGRLK